VPHLHHGRCKTDVAIEFNRSRTYARNLSSRAPIHSRTQPFPPRKITAALVIFWNVRRKYRMTILIFILSNCICCGRDISFSAPPPKSQQPNSLIVHIFSNNAPGTGCVNSLCTREECRNLMLRLRMRLTGIRKPVHLISDNQRNRLTSNVDISTWIRTMMRINRTRLCAFQLKGFFMWQA